MTKIEEKAIRRDLYEPSLSPELKNDVKNLKGIKKLDRIIHNFTKQLEALANRIDQWLQGRGHINNERVAKDIQKRVVVLRQALEKNPHLTSLRKGDIEDEISEMTYLRNKLRDETGAKPEAVQRISQAIRDLKTILSQAGEKVIEGAAKQAQRVAAKREAAAVAEKAMIETFLESVKPADADQEICIEVSLKGKGKQLLKYVPRYHSISEGALRAQSLETSERVRVPISDVESIDIMPPQIEFLLDFIEVRKLVEKRIMFDKNGILRPISEGTYTLKTTLDRYTHSTIISSNEGNKIATITSWFFPTERGSRISWAGEGPTTKEI